MFEKNDYYVYYIRIDILINKFIYFGTNSYNINQTSYNTLYRKRKDVMMLTIRTLNEKYSNELAEILSTDEKLHRELSPNSKLVIIDGMEHLSGCMKWENKKEENVLP